MQTRLLFKKRMFRETDENISEPQFINLSYVQAQHDYLAGNYPVVREDAAQVRCMFGRAPCPTHPESLMLVLRLQDSAGGSWVHGLHMACGQGGPAGSRRLSCALRLQLSLLSPSRVHFADRPAAGACRWQHSRCMPSTAQGWTATTLRTSTQPWSASSPGRCS